MISIYFIRRRRRRIPNYKALNKDMEYRDTTVNISLIT